jgi:hypothetical protein
MPEETCNGILAPKSEELSYCSPPKFKIGVRPKEPSMDRSSFVQSQLGLKSLTLKIVLGRYNIPISNKNQNSCLPYHVAQAHRKIAFSIYR